MLKPIALANAFWATTLGFYSTLFILKFLAPPFFELILNSQYLGASVAQEFPKVGFFAFLGAAITISTVAWIFGYFIAVVYNKHTKIT